MDRKSKQCDVVFEDDQVGVVNHLPCGRSYSKKLQSEKTVIAKNIVRYSNISTMTPRNVEGSNKYQYMLRRRTHLENNDISSCPYLVLLQSSINTSWESLAIQTALIDYHLFQKCYGPYSLQHRLRSCSRQASALFSACACIIA